MMEINQAADEFLEEIKSVKRYSPNTIKSYSEDICDFLKYCEAYSKIIRTGYIGKISEIFSYGIE